MFVAFLPWQIAGQHGCGMKNEEGSGNCRYYYLAGAKELQATASEGTDDHRCGSA